MGKWGYSAATRAWRLSGARQPRATGSTRAKAPVRIGFLATGAAESANSVAQIDEIKHGLRETGLMEGRDYVLDVQFASGDYQLFPIGGLHSFRQRINAMADDPVLVAVLLCSRRREPPRTQSAGPSPAGELEARQ